VYFVCFYTRVVTNSGHFVLRFHVRPSSVTFRTCFVVSAHSCVCVSQPPRGYIFWTFRSSLFRHIPFSHICTLSNIHFCSCCHCHFSRHATQKRFATGRVTSAATKIALLRTTATPQETAATLAYPTNRSAASRARETPQETEARLADQRKRAAASRARETPQETEARLADQRKRAAASRARETPQETEARLADQRKRAAASRASETPHETGAIAPKNNSVHKLNLQIQNMLPTNSRTYKSADVVMDHSQALLYPVEFLNSLEHTGIPPRKLELKVGVPIILL